MVRNSKLHGLSTLHTAGIYSDMTVDGPKIGTLVVIIDRAKNLPDRKTIGKQNPYCAARLGKDAKKTETDHRGGQTPKWDQELRFTVHDSPDYYQLKVAVFNEDRKTELVGETWIDLKGVIISGGGQNDTWHGLNYKGKYAGEIRVEITYYDTRCQQDSNENESPVLKTCKSLPFLDKSEREPKQQCRDALNFRPLSLNSVNTEKTSGDRLGSNYLKYVSPGSTHDHKETMKRPDRSLALGNFEHFDESRRSYTHMPKYRLEDKRTNMHSIPTSPSTDNSDHPQIVSRTGYRSSGSRSPKLGSTTVEYGSKVYIPRNNSDDASKSKVGDDLSKFHMQKPASRYWLQENDTCGNRERRARHCMTKESTMARNQNISQYVQYYIPDSRPPIKAYSAVAGPKEPPPPPPIHRNLNIIRKQLSEGVCGEQRSQKNASEDASKHDPRFKNLLADDQPHLLRTYNIHKSHQSHNSEGHEGKHHYLLKEVHQEPSLGHRKYGLGQCKG